MSRAEQRTLPPAPRLGRVLRTAAEDLYYHGVRLVAANTLWGIGAALTAYSVSRSVAGFLALAVMVPLTIGLMGMATAVVRERSVVMSDFARAIRGRFWRLFALAMAQFALTALAAFDLALGVQIGDIVGVIMAVIAFYTLLAIWVLALTVWPIVTDPERRTEPVRSAVRLGALLVMAHPIRMSGMALVLAVATVASTILVAAIVTFGAAYVALVAAHFVLPSADRLEGRETMIVEGSEP